MAGEGTVLLVPVPLVSIALCEGGWLGGYLMELYMEEWPAPASKVVL